MPTPTAAVGEPSDGPSLFPTMSPTFAIDDAGDSPTAAPVPGVPSSTPTNLPMDTLNPSSQPSLSNAPSVVVAATSSFSVSEGEDRRQHTRIFTSHFIDLLFSNEGTDQMDSTGEEKEEVLPASALTSATAFPSAAPSASPAPTESTDAL